MAFMAFFLVCRYGTMRDNVINLQVVFLYSYIIKKNYIVLVRHTKSKFLLVLCRLFYQMVMLSRQVPGLERVQPGMEDTLLIVRITPLLFCFRSELYFHCLVYLCYICMPFSCYRFSQLSLPLPC